MNKDGFDKLSKDEIIEAIKLLPINIFIKNTEAEYEASSNFYDENEDIIGKTSLTTNKDKNTAKKSYDIDREIIETGQSKKYIKSEIVNNEERFVEVTKMPILDENGKVKRIVGMSEDITARIKLEEYLNDRAHKDYLTGLYNRTYLSFWSKNKNTKELYPLILFSIDCNDLKVINDRYGHIVGDQYLKYTAEILKNTFPSNSIISRIGGDEFVVIVPNSNEKQALEYLKVLKSSAKKVKIFDSTLSMAIGFSIVDDYSSNLDIDIDSADKEMYKDKAMYKDKVKIKKLNAK